MSLEDYDFSKRKVCPNNDRFSCIRIKHDILDKYCSKCGSELIEEELPIEIELLHNDRKIKMYLEDFILLLKSKW